MVRYVTSVKVRGTKTKVLTNNATLINVNFPAILSKTTSNDRRIVGFAEKGYFISFSFT